MFCLAGADWPEDFALHHRELTSRIGLARTATVFNDAIATLRAGTPDAVGVGAVVGTGGAIAGRNARGETWHLGFWPDGMAAGGIARAGLRAVYRNGLGHDRPTTLSARALPAVRRARRARAAAPLQPARAEAGRRGAGAGGVRGGRRGRRGGARDHRDRRVAVRRRGAHDGASSSGSSRPTRWCWRAGCCGIRQAVLHADAIARFAPDAIAVRAHWEPVVGALLMACDEAGVEPDPDTLRTSLPSGTFFATRSDP